MNILILYVKTKNIKILYFVKFVIHIIEHCILSDK